MARQTKENPAVGATGSNQVLRENNSRIVAAIAGFPVKLAVISAGGLVAVGADALVRWLGWLQ